MKHRLNFLNPQYHRGMNVTVRKGAKWFNKASVGDTVDIFKTGDYNPIESGVIRQIRYVPYFDVCLQDLCEEHDRECGTPFGLTHAMLRAYPDFTLDDMVTVIRFELQ